MEQTPPATDEAKRRSLFVHALPMSTTTEELANVFSQSFPLKHATIVLDPTSKLSKGYGFVTFTDPSDALEALRVFDGALLNGHKIKVELAKPRSRGPGSGGGLDTRLPESSSAGMKVRKGRQQASDEPPPQLIIRNLPWTINKPEQLAALFRSYGKVKRATLPKRKPGLSAGFGFVVLRGRKNSEKALMEINGKVIDGRTLAVDWAVGKDVWESMNQSKGIDAAHVDPSPAAADDQKDSSSGIEDPGITIGKPEEQSHADAESLRDGEDSDMPDEDATEASPTSNIKQGPSSTLFVRNVPFTAVDEDLSHHFASFGPVRYARVVLDPSTGRSKGTAFVSFWDKANAVACLRAAPKIMSLSTSSERAQPSLSNITSKKSLLEDSSIDSSGRYTMDGRILQLSRAVDKGEAARLTAAGHGIRTVRDRDKRRLYLLGEGTIPKQSPLYDQLAPSEIALREESARQRQNLIKNNPALHLSLTRLSVRNLPRSVTSKDLKALAREAVVGFSRDVKTGLRQPLSREELSRAGDSMREAERARKAKGKGIVKQSKVVFEGKKGEKVTEESGAGRSKGYAFIEYTSHRWALMGLRWLNGYAVGTRSGDASKISGSDERKKRLIVEFAIENAQVVGRRQERETQSHDKRTSPKSRTMLDMEDNTKQLAADNKKSKGMIRAGAKRKRSLDTSSDHLKEGRGAIDQQESDAALSMDRLAKRQKVIARKRMARRARKSD
ncbi:MAG: hypothetical protein Q9209_003275 [Squamulea sp. 1 TL-2023]